ncbi:hypothetical protein N0V82_006284 [Gnomoniopsis sp. IMI 355080]|nr:hypothetical protein N0V82_006284 [Gnomoniopsis sp. IMI 355080]
MGDAQNPQHSRFPALLHYADHFVQAVNKAQSLAEEADSRKAILLNEIEIKQAELRDLQERIQNVQTSKAEKERELYDLETTLSKDIEHVEADAFRVLRPEMLGSYAEYARGPGYQTTTAQISQGTVIGMRHIGTGHDRVMLPDNSDGDECGSVDTSLAVEPDAIYARNELVAIDPGGLEDAYDSASVIRGIDNRKCRTISAQVAPDQTAECGLRGDILETESMQQHNMNLPCPNSSFGHDEVLQLSGTRASFPNDGRDQEVIQNGDRLSELTTSDDSQSIDSQWQSQLGIGDKHADAYDKEVAEAFGQFPSNEIIVDPIVGQLYQCPWDDGEGGSIKPVWYYVTRLPFGNYDEIGISGRLNGSPLCNQSNIPPCCRVSKDPHRPVTWAPGFEKGGPWVTRRKFPFLFLEKGLDIPPPGEWFSIPADPPCTAWIEVKTLRSENHQHPPEHDISGLRDGIAVVDAFKLRLVAIRESMVAGLHFEFAPASPYPASASTTRTIEAELWGPSAKKRISLEEYKRSKRSKPSQPRSPRSPSLTRRLKDLPQSLALRQNTPLSPDWDQPGPQYNKYGVQIFEDE